VYDSLDYKEARRFFTAAYLFWEYQALFFNPLRQVTLNNGLDIDADGDEDDDDYEGDDMDWRDDDDDEEDDEEEEDDGEQDKDTPEKRKIAESNTKSTIEQFLNDLPARELVWMHHYKEFLLAEVGEYLQSYPPPWPSLTSATSGLSYPLLSEGVCLLRFE
jgi:DNA-directed RNA polymerase specialized sigma24 family protein